MFKLMKTLILSSACVVGSQSIAQELNPSIPTYHPSCNAVFENAGMKVLTNEDCSTVFLAPADIGQTYSNVEVTSHAKEQCESLKESHDAFRTVQTNIREIQESIFEATMNNESSTVERLEVALEHSLNHSDWLNEMMTRASGVLGAKVTVMLHNEVTDEDEKRFVEMNSSVFQNLGYMPRIHRASLKDSIYSFNFINEPVLSTRPMILATTMPGLESLNQIGAQQERVAHVLSNGPLSGQIDVSLNAICKADSESGVSTDNLESLLVVNRVYNIETLSQYGYKATFNAKSVTKAIGRRISSSTDHGYTQSQLNEIIFSSDFSDDFTIEFFEGHTPTNPLVVNEIIEDVNERLKDKYMKALEEANLIDVTGYEDYIPAQGGTATVQQTGRVCKRKWYGSKRCWDRVYDVKKWIDGHSELEVDEYSELNVDFSEEVYIDEIVKKPMGSTFGTFEMSQGSSK